MVLGALNFFYGYEIFLTPIWLHVNLSTMTMSSEIVEGIIFAAVYMQNYWQYDWFEMNLN